MKATIFLFLLFFGCGLSSQKNEELKFPKALKEISSKEIPNSITINGKLITAKSWEDKNGENLLIVSFSGPTPEKEYRDEFSGAERHAELHSVLYIKKNKEYNALWSMHDSIRHCPFDMWIGLLPESTTVTDLDNDSIAEITLVSKKTCRSDVSPSSLRIQIFEKDSVMELVGSMEFKQKEFMVTDSFIFDLTKIRRTGEPHEAFGRYLGEYSFANKPKVFLEYAREKWKEYVRKDEFLQLEDE